MVVIFSIAINTFYIMVAKKFTYLFPIVKKTYLYSVTTKYEIILIFLAERYLCFMVFMF